MAENKISSMEDLLNETGAANSNELDLSGTSSVPYDEVLDSPIIGQQYLAKFHPVKGHEDELEERESSVVSGVHFDTLRQMQTYLDQGYEKITIEEQNALVDGKIRNIVTKELCDRPAVKISVDSKIQSLLYRIDAFTAKEITGGFVSECAGVAVKYDSDNDTQSTSTQISNAGNANPELFAAAYPNGCPFRGYRKLEDETFAEYKEIFYLDLNGVNQFSADLILHIGNCKVQGWTLQTLAKSANEETFDEVKAQVEAVIGEEPKPEEPMM